MSNPFFKTKQEIEIEQLREKLRNAETENAELTDAVLELAEIIGGAENG